MRPIALLAIAGNRTYFGKEYGIQELLAAGIAEGLLDPGSFRAGDVLGVSLTPKGKELLATSSPSDIGGPDDTWDRLWAYLLAHGGVSCGYATMRPDAVVHLAECGLDTAASTTPGDDNWTEFAGTFAEDDRHSGLSGRGTCRCGLVRGVTVHADYPETSLAGMIRAATGDWAAFVDGVAGSR